jgi:Coenzyme PQQ synthesis protein D (PqqD)
MSGGRSANPALAPSSSVLFQEIEGETVLLDLEREHYFSLDVVGSRIWQLLVEHGDMEALVSAMLNEFDVDEATLRRDVADLLDRLEAEGLIVSAPRA